MSRILKLRLKPGERLFVNGAVMQVDRRVSLSFLNNVNFLLEAYVIQPEQVTTPLKEIYFVIQSMLIDPTTREEQKGLLKYSLLNISGNDSYSAIVSQIEDGIRLAQEDQCFEALKLLRSLFEIEAGLLQQQTDGEPTTQPAERMQKALAWK